MAEEALPFLDMDRKAIVAVEKVVVKPSIVAVVLHIREQDSAVHNQTGAAEEQNNLTDRSVPLKCEDRYVVVVVVDRAEGELHWMAAVAVD